MNGCYCVYRLDLDDDEPVYHHIYAAYDFEMNIVINDRQCDLCFNFVSRFSQFKSEARLISAFQ